MPGPRTFERPHRTAETRRAGVLAPAAPRTLHLLDLENLLGGCVTGARCARVWQEYCAVVGVAPGDHVLMAVARQHAATAAFGMPVGIQRLIGDDVPDGADRALVAAVDVRHACARFQRIVIGSGDHYFTQLALDFRSAGRDVAQVLGAARYVAASLYRACPTNHVLPIHRLPCTA